MAQGGLRTDPGGLTAGLSPYYGRSCDNSSSQGLRDTRRAGEGDGELPAAPHGEIGPGFGFHEIAVEACFFGRDDPRRTENRFDQAHQRGVQPSAAANDVEGGLLRQMIPGAGDGGGGETGERRSTIPRGSGR